MKNLHSILPLDPLPKIFERHAFIRLRENADLSEARRERLERFVSKFARTTVRLWDGNLRKSIPHSARRGNHEEIFSAFRSIPDEERVHFEVLVMEKKKSGMEIKPIRTIHQLDAYLEKQKQPINPETS